MYTINIQIVYDINAQPGINTAGSNANDFSKDSPVTSASSKTFMKFR